LRIGKKVEHLVLFRFKTMTRNEQKLKLIDNLKSLKEVVEGMEAVTVGFNKTDEVDFVHGFEVSMRMLFRDHDALVAYRIQPEHQKVIEYSKVIVDQVIVADLETD
jgi:hypothetical protein